MTHSRNGGDTEDDLPPSCRCVLLAFRARDADRLSWQALQNSTGLPDRTLSWALDRLENDGIIHLTRKYDDLRQTAATLASTRDLNGPEGDNSEERHG